MCPSVKHSNGILPRPTKASLARQTKIRSSILTSSTAVNTFKASQVDQGKSENDSKMISLTKRTGFITKNHFLFKRQKSSKKLAVIVSNSSLDNSTGDGDRLKQVIVASLIENVKKIDISGSDNKENCSSKCTTTQNKKHSSPLIDNYLAEELKLEQIETSNPNENVLSRDADDDEEEELIDPSYAMDYIADIMNLLYTLEKKYPLSSSYLSNSLSLIKTIANGSAIRPWKLSAKHRTIVVGWLIQLFYAKFHLSQDAMHICIGLFDRFIQRCMTSTNGSNGLITQKNLQLIAVATFLVATKIEETHHPPVEELVYVTDYAYTSDQVKRMEKNILHELCFELNRPTSLQFLRRYSFISSANDEQHAIGKFLIDISLLDASCIDLPPSLLAASATYIARYILNRNESSTFEQCWPYDLQIRSPYKTFQSLSNGIQILAKCIDSCLCENSSKEYETLVKRYEHEQLMKASVCCMEQRTLIHKLATEKLVK